MLYPDGTTAESIYDALGRPVINAYPHLPGDLATGLRLVYDAAGRVVRKEQLSEVRIDVVEDSEHPGLQRAVLVGEPVLTGVGSRRYDAAGRMIESIEPYGMVTSYEYDELGRQSAVIVDATGFAYRAEFTHDAAGRRQTLGPDGITRELFYDALGRVIAFRYPDGGMTSQEFDAVGRVIKTTDPMGQVTEYEYDAAGRQTAVILPAVPDPSNPEQLVRSTTRYQYDQQGRLLSVTDAEGHSTTFRYDPSGLLLERRTALGHTETKEYDSTGLLTGRTDAMGRRVQYGYDAVGRLTTETWLEPGSTEPAEVVRYAFDQLAQLDTVTDSHGVTDYDLDAKGRVIRVTSPEGTIDYEWDDLRNLLTRTCTGDAAAPTSDIRYQYDAVNRLVVVTVVRQNGQPVNQTTRYAYGAANELTGVTFWNGVDGVYDYDEMGRLEGITYSRAGEPIETISYTLDALGQRVAMTTVSPDESRRVDYAYDALGRLVRQDFDSGARVVTYTYDLVGNRLRLDDSAAGSTEYLYDGNDRLLAEHRPDQTIQYGYDDSGATISEVVQDPLTAQVVTATSYEYDGRGRMTGADVGANGSIDYAYVYDSAGTLIGKSTGTDESVYLVDHNSPTGYSQVLEEHAPGGLTASYAFGHGPISQWRADGQEGVYLRDGLGSVVAITAADGAVTIRYAYDAFGDLLVSGGQENPYLFAGERLDGDLGQYELRARRYRPSTGRFTTADPLQSASLSNLNQYTYASANPVVLTDPSGQFTVMELAIAMGSVATAVAIALPVYKTGMGIKKLLDYSEYATLIRKGRNKEWIGLERYVVMHDTVKELSLGAARQVFESMRDVVKEVITSYGAGQVLSFIELFGGSEKAGGETNIDEFGQVSVLEGVGDATVISAVANYNRARQLGHLHHLIPYGVLSRQRYIRENLVGIEKYLHVGSTGLHSLIGNNPTFRHLRPVEGRTYRKIINSFTPPPDPRQQYLDQLEQAYTWLETTYPNDYAGLTQWYSYAKQYINVTDLVI